MTISKIPHVVLDSGAIGIDWNLTLYDQADSLGYAITKNGDSFQAACLVWVDYTGVPNNDHNLGYLLETWLLSVDHLSINGYWAWHDHCRKPLQFQAVSQIAKGLEHFTHNDDPTTVWISNLSKFSAEADNDVVCKPITSGPVIGITKDSVAETVKGWHAPGCVQDYWDGQLFRAYVTAKDVCVLKVTWDKSKHVDYRAADPQFEVVDGDQVASDLRDIAEVCKCSYSAIEFITRGDKYQFLECNPAPHWMHADTIADNKPGTMLLDLIKETI